MGIGDKMSHKAEELGGKAKAAYGDATDNERLEAEGHAQEMGAKAKQTGDKVREGGEKVADTIKHKATESRDAADRKL